MPGQVPAKHLPPDVGAAERCDVLKDLRVGRMIEAVGDATCGRNTPLEIGCRRRCKTGGAHAILAVHPSPNADAMPDAKRKPTPPTAARLAAARERLRAGPTDVEIQNDYLLLLGEAVERLLGEDSPEPAAAGEVGDAAGRPAGLNKTATLHGIVRDLCKIRPGGVTAGWALIRAWGSLNWLNWANRSTRATHWRRFARRATLSWQRWSRPCWAPSSWRDHSG